MANQPPSPEFYAEIPDEWFWGDAVWCFGSGIRFASVYMRVPTTATKKFIRWTRKGWEERDNGFQEWKLVPLPDYPSDGQKAEIEAYRKAVDAQGTIVRYDKDGNRLSECVIETKASS